ncbi:hypothetical protein JW756_02365 [Candidatus Woesearchaeota archaeon]|nr:hypothetical protein [Candidatus Woesearchaeota archaeon]
MDDREVQKRVKAGAILAQVSFEVVGNPKEYVENTMRGFVNNLKNSPGITILSEELGEPEEVAKSNGLWSTYADTEMLIDNLDKLAWMCINFMPSSIEIIAPEEIRVSEKDLTNWMNDLMAKLHEITLTVRQTNVKDEAMIKGMNALIQNSILLATEHYHKPAEIGTKIGIPESQLQPFFDALVKQAKLEKKGDEYFRKGLKTEEAREPDKVEEKKAKVKKEAKKNKK